MPDNTVEFRLTVSGASESVANVERVRTALSGVALSLDRNLGAMIASDNAEKQSVVTMDKYEAGVQGMIKAQALAANYADDSYSKHLLMAKAVNAARDAVQGATAPTTLWAKGISDAAAAAASGAQPYSNLAAAYGRTGSAGQQFTGSLRSAHRELFEGARLTSDYAVALVGRVAPGLQSVLGDFTALRFATQGMSLAMTGAVAAGLAVAIGMGTMLSRVRELTDAQRAANKAIAELDVSQARNAFAQAAEAVRQYDFALGEARSGTGWSMIVGQIDAFSGAVSQARAKAIAAGEAVAQTWEFFGKGQAILGVERDELTEQAKAFALLAARAPDVETLTKALDDQAVALHDAAVHTVSLARNEDARYQAMQQRQIAALAGAENEDLRAKLTDQLAEEMATRGRQRTAAAKSADDDLATTKIANAARTAGINAQEISDAGRLIEIKGRIAKADADFFGAAVRGWALVALQAQHAKEIEAQQTKIGGLQGPEQQAAMRELERMQAEHDLRITEERRAAYARDLGLVAASYAQAQALGQEDLAVKLGFLQRAGNDENLSLQQRRAYQAQFYSEAKQAEAAVAQYKVTIGRTSVTEELTRLRSLADGYAANSSERIAAEQAYAARYLAVEQSLFASLKASGQLSTTEEVARLQELADRYQANSAARIAAEQQWASAALALRQQVASAGQGLIARVVSELQAEGNAYISLGQIQARVAQDQQKALATLSSGGTAKEIQDALSLAGAFTELTKAGVGAGDAISRGVEAARNALNGTRESVTGVTTSMGGLGSMTEANFSKIEQAVKNASEQTKAWGQAAMAAAGEATEGTRQWISGFDATKHAIEFVRDAETGIVTMTNEVGFAFDDAKNKALGIGQTITGVGDSARMMGDAFQQGSQAAMTDLAQVETAAQQVTHAFDGFRTTIPTAMATGLDGALGLVDSFVNAVNAKMASGTSTWGDTFMTNFMRHLQLALDAAARAS